jgi:hypothetical protein
MNVGAAKALFRSYTDEPDNIWLTNADMGTYLNMALDEWIGIIRRYGPQVIAESKQYNFSAQPDAVKPHLYAMDLSQATLTPTTGGAGALMGPNGVTDLLLAVYEYDNANNLRGMPMVVVPSRVALEWQPEMHGVAIQNNILYFPITPPTTIAIDYVPKRTTDFLAAADDVEVFGGKLAEFHELIVLLACRRYFVRDDAKNRTIDEMTRRVEARFIPFLQDAQIKGTGRSVEASTIF